MLEESFEDKIFEENIRLVELNELTNNVKSLTKSIIDSKINLLNEKYDKMRNM